MNLPQAPPHRRVSSSVRYQARLDAETSAKLQDLARTFRRKRSAILRHVMQWGLTQTRGWTVDMAVPGTVRTLSLLLEPELLQQVQKPRRPTGLALWYGCGTRCVRSTVTTFRNAGPQGGASGRLHESGHYQRRFTLRLDDETANTSEMLTQTFNRPAAEIIRQLITQARPEKFPQGWLLAVKERQELARGHVLTHDDCLQRP